MEIRNYKYIKSEAGGFKEVIFLVNGDDIYSYLKYESGYIEFKEYLKQKLKEECIHQQLL